MKKTIFILAMLGLLLAGCGASQEPVDTPTLAPTDTPVPPTSTPEPTATPEPTSTPTPTPEPIPVSLTALMEEMGLVQMENLMLAEATEYGGGYYRWSIGLNNSILDRWEVARDYPDIYLTRAESYIRLGDFENAIQDLQTAEQLPYVDQFKRTAVQAADMDVVTQSLTETEMILISGMYNNLCWHLAIANQPEQALPYCEEAVTLSPSDAAILDSRAVVYAMLGRSEEAAAEFEEVLALAEDDPGFSSSLVEERNLWITALNNGEDPFTPEALALLQMESVDPYAYPEPELLENYSLQHFTQILSQDGFVLVDSGTNDSGIQYEMYGLKFGTCYNYVGLFITGEEVGMARMILADCDEEQFIAEMRWFAKLLLMNDPREDMDCIEMGEWYAWELTDLRDLVDGNIDQTVSFSIGGITFEADRGENPDLGTTITVTGR